MTSPWPCPCPHCAPLPERAAADSIVLREEEDGHYRGAHPPGVGEPLWDPCGRAHFLGMTQPSPHQVWDGVAEVHMALNNQATGLLVGPRRAILKR